MARFRVAASPEAANVRTCSWPNVKIRRGVRGLLQQQPGLHRGNQRLAEGADLDVRVAQLLPNGLEIAQAEASSQHGGVAHGGAGFVGEPGRPPVDEGSHGRRHQALRVLGEGPDPIDLLDHGGFAVGPGQLLDDERDPFGLGVHDRGALRIDRAGQHLPDELGGFDLGEPGELEPPDQPHPFHVREQRHQLSHQGHLVGSNGAEQKDRVRRIAPDDVAEHPERVVVGPLKVVDQQGQWRLRGDDGERHRREIECAQQSRVGRQGLQARLRLTRDGGHGATDGFLCPGSRDRLTQGWRGEDALGQQERPTDLLICGDRDGGEAGRGGQLGGGHQQPGLPDAGLSLQRDRGQPFVSGLELLLDGGQLGGAPHDRFGDPSQLHGQGALGLHHWVQHASFGRSQQGSQRSFAVALVVGGIDDCHIWIIHR